VTVHRTTVTLKGAVGSLTDRVPAANAAWAAPGIASVINEIAVNE